ncbi:MULTISPECIES: hypothetical protein [Acidithiobacillus]|uniref:Uncharacterized protein n=1 Tax=Acidithiobacillus thiooxidans ATCC 19377 TaxID=637390 RepID=A0A5P9XQ25_ACITH|nr:MULTISPECIES: hypothetical protein [Acidithiobacillus]MBU2742387.1 hypothetical protein [Acidithiobacillus albertensis]MBU2794298.1 hypothetical protein [Acidithiobacillus thiooxidans]MDA8177151.1 hypothetical protein [Acidithiobacillus sp.]QFX95473.1 hypothetical protein GCD22_01053 [Acidithiobacillus thiooxidans ATCC 19377]
MSAASLTLQIRWGGLPHWLEQALPLKIAADCRVGRQRHNLPPQGGLQVVVVQLGGPAWMLPVWGLPPQPLTLRDHQRL